MYTLFFSLIRLSIGTANKLSRRPSVDEWGELYRMAVKQSLVGVCFVGIRRYIKLSGQNYIDVGIPKKIYFQWVATADYIQNRNELMNQRCVELQSNLSLHGFTSSILKGQGIALLYGELNSFRQPGDIDVYVNCGRKKAIEYARAIGQEIITWDYKHLHLKIFEDAEVEMHYRPEVLLNLIKNNRLQRWFQTDEVQKQIFQRKDEMIIPSVEFNLFYILLHIYRHFLYEGVGLRQLMDYYFVLKFVKLQHNENIGKHDIKHMSLEAIEAFGMVSFARGIMWIMQHLFGMEELCLLYKPDEKEGRYILSEIMKGGNFGHYDERLKQNVCKSKIVGVGNILRHNIHLVKNYLDDVFWSPVWIVYHWCWKRIVKKIT